VKNITKRGKRERQDYSKEQKSGEGRRISPM